MGRISGHNGIGGNRPLNGPAGTRGHPACCERAGVHLVNGTGFDSCENKESPPPNATGLGGGRNTPGRRSGLLANNNMSQLRSSGAPPRTTKSHICSRCVRRSRPSTRPEPLKRPVGNTLKKTVAGQFEFQSPAAPASTNSTQQKAPLGLHPGLQLHVFWGPSLAQSRPGPVMHWPRAEAQSCGVPYEVDDVHPSPAIANRVARGMFIATINTAAARFTRAPRLRDRPP
jgi:hypothetical protein